ncbi:signal peptide peptidase SppA [Sphingomonas sp. SUN039]|uniref:signal peptide peptidase SppA n=1 Tax=Sphingomonas sp. SUN039 TaxID=2937787 RepID=UPI00216414DC|nr:signal peptide peptidase SppA [Sphingomonas sp. SUN039]UVO54884.1 signal peptide peptidase SppA [Sphingomonas sp. SUN039]
MNLVRGAWRILVGIKDGLVLLFMLLFFGALAAALTARPGTKSIGTGALVMELKGSIVEQPASISPTEALTGGSQMKQYRLRDIIAALDAAATDDRVKTVVLDLDGFTGGGQVALGDVGAALDKVKAKKPVLAFATGYSDDAYQLAAHASEIWLDPMGLALFQGPGGSRLYYKGLLEKVGANVHVYRVGTYKSAVEPYILDKQSPAAKEAATALYASLWQGWQAEVGKARPKAQLAAFIADPAGAVAASGDTAVAALKAGIVDKLADRAAFDKRVAQIAGAGRKEQAYARIELKPYIAAKARKTGDKAVGVVTVAGIIQDGEAEAGTAGGETIGKIVDKAVASGKYKALVLRVDSPGGSALASERIRSALVAARAKGMPVVVSMGNVAASGGYWVAMASDKVFAEPSTITGSIGIFGIIPTFENGLKKIGITADGVATTPLTGQPDVVGGTNAAFDGVVQTAIESGYKRFLNLVGGARKMTPEKVDGIAQGRVWDGGTARQLGLVDAFGGVDDAITEAARLAKLDPAEPHAVWLDKQPGWREAFAAIFGPDEEEGGATDLLSTLSRARMATLAGAVEDARTMMASSVVQARCLECPVAAAPVKPATVMQLLTAWMGA